MKVVLSQDEKYVVDESKDFHSEHGVLSSKDMMQDGRIESSKGKKFTVAKPLFFDIWRKMKRGPQMPLPKDIGAIIAYTGIGKDSVIVDAGAGSGGIALFLAHLVKHVYTYDVREDHCTIVRKNAEFLCITNITITCKDITLGIAEKDVDLFTLDVPEPWNCVEALKSVRLGGFVVSYSPQLTQTQKFIQVLSDDFIVERTIELMEREWKISPTILKPSSEGLHSGFLTFIRRV